MTEASRSIGNLQYLVEGVREGHASAVPAASIFHFDDASTADAYAAWRAAALAAWIESNSYGVSGPSRFNNAELAVRLSSMEPY